MRLSYKLYLLLLAAIVGGCLFFIAIHRTERLLAAQSETLGRIEEIQRQDQRLDLELTNAAFRLYFDFDQVIEAIGRIGELTGELLELPYLDDDDFALVREGFSAYRTQLAHKEDLALRFGTVNAVVKNSTTHIPSLAHRYLSSAGQIDAAYLKEISDVTSAVFLASNSLDADFVERLGASVERLSAMEHDSADIRALHRPFLAHARALLRWLPEYGSMLDATLSLPTRTTLVAAKERFMAVSNRKADGIRSISLVLAAAFIAAVATILANLLTLARQYNELDQLHRRLEGSATIDRLTGLANRFAYQRAAPHPPGSVLLLFNLDGFRHFNDFYGSDAGDFVLLRLADELRQMVAEIPGASAYRVGADDFSLLLGVSDDDAAALATRLQARIEDGGCRYHDHDLALSVTASCSRVSPRLETADMALKKARQQRAKYLEYDPALKLETRAADNLRVIGLLKDALSGGFVVPFFQPIFDNRQGCITRYECLMRIRNRDDRLMFPKEFLGIAQKSRLYGDLTRVMIDRSMERFHGRSEDFSINLSIDDIRDRYVCGHLFQRLAQDPETARRMTIELLESEGVDDYDQLKQFVAEARGYGCSIAVDDFGSGYSSLLHVLKLKVDNLKIDGTLIRDLEHDRHARILVESIVSFARQIGIAKLTAEYVHDAAVFELVKAIGIDYAQGYYIGRPEADLVTDPAG